jgi:hypothetical protein
MPPTKINVSNSSPRILASLKYQIIHPIISTGWMKMTTTKSMEDKIRMIK